MERKKVAMWAAAINALLLLILFVASLTTKTELLSEMTEWQEARSQFVMDEPPEQVLVYQPKEPEEPIHHLLPQVQVPLIPATPVVVQDTQPLSPPPRPAPISAPMTATAPAVVPEDVSLQEVIVQKGDSLEKIARRCHTTVDAIVKTNQLSNHFLKVGQRIKIPPIATPTSATPAYFPEGAEYYTIKVGDNPWSIAMKHHLKLEELLKLNGLNEEKARKLKPGDRLRIR